MKKRYLVTVIKDNKVFTYGVKTIGGRDNAISLVRNIKTGEYFIHARESEEEADYEMPEEKLIIPSWVNNFT